MKKIYLLALSVMAVTLGYTQTIIDPPSASVENIESTAGDVVAASLVFNQTSDSAGYIWERNVIELTDGWLTAVCDKNLCHFPTVDNATFGLEANSSGTMDVHIYTDLVDPNGVDGAAIIEVKVTNVLDEEDFAEAIYFFNQALSAPERITNALKIYPNPVVSQFFIEGADAVQRIEIYNISGKLVKEVQSFGQGSVNVDGLGTGNYIVRMWDEANTQISTNVLTVQ